MRRKSIDDAAQVSSPSTADICKQAAANVSARIAAALEKHGITADLLADKLLEELNADKVFFFSRDGIVTDEREVADYSIRQRARMDAHALLDHYPATRHDVTTDGEQLSGTVSPEVMRIFEAVMDTAPKEPEPPKRRPWGRQSKLEQ